MLQSFQSVGSVLLSNYKDPYSWGDASGNILKYFTNTSSYTSDYSFAGAGSGISDDGLIMVCGRVHASASSNQYVYYSNDAGITWHLLTTPWTTTGIGTLYYRGGFLMVSAQVSAGIQPTFCDTPTLNTSSATTAIISGSLSAATRSLLCENAVTTTTGRSYCGYQGFFKQNNNLGISASTSSWTASSYVGGVTDGDIDPINGQFAIISTTSTLATANIYILSPSNNFGLVTSTINALIISVSCSQSLMRVILQTSNATYLMTGIDFSLHTATVVQLSNGTNLPSGVGAGAIASQSKKTCMSYNGHVICVIDMNTNIGYAYLSVDSGSTWICINTHFGLSSTIFVSCEANLGTTVNYILLQSTVGAYRLKLSSLY